MKHARLQLHSHPFANIEEPNMKKKLYKMIYKTILRPSFKEL